MHLEYTYNLCLAQSLSADYDNLLKLDVFGSENDNNEITKPVYERFKEKLS